jgi:hypothetical protein
MSLLINAHCHCGIRAVAIVFKKIEIENRLIHSIYYTIHQRFSTTTTNNNNQAFYSPASWGRLEMKEHEPKNRDKTRVKKKGCENKGRQKTKSKREKRQ